MTRARSTDFRPRELARLGAVVFFVLAGLELVKRCNDTLFRWFPELTEWGVGGLPYYLLWLVPLGLVALAFPNASETPWALRRRGRPTIIAAVLGLAVAGLAHVYWHPLSSLLNGSAHVHWPPRSSTLAWTVALTAPPLVEEWLFRGILWRSFAGDSEAWPRLLMTLVLTSWLFAVSHLPTMVPGSVEHATPLLDHLWFGGVMGVLRWRFRSVLPGVLAHALCNGLIPLVTW